MCDYGEKYHEVIGVFHTSNKFVVGVNGSNQQLLKAGDCCSVWWDASYYHDFVYVGNNNIVERSSESGEVD